MTFQWLGSVFMLPSLKFLTATLLLLGTMNLMAQDGKEKKIQRMLAKGDTLKAGQQLNKLIDKYPNYAPFYWERAKLKLAKDDFQPALIDLNTYTSLGGRSEPVNYYKALIISKKGNYPAALSLVGKHLKQFPDDLIAIELRANCLYNMKEYETALDGYARVLKLKPYQAKSLYNAGICAYESVHYELADSLFYQAHKARPLDGAILFARGMNLNKMRKYDESAQILKKLTTLEVDNGRAWYNLGVNYYYLNRSEEACKAWETADQHESLPAKQALEKYCLSEKAPAK